MKHIVSIWHLTLRKILAALMGIASFLFGACHWPRESPSEYGPGPRPPEPILPVEVICGTVKDGYGVSVSGFWVSILNEHNSPLWPYTFTNENGKFRFDIFEYDNFYNQENGSYTLFFQDVDGHLNGEFNSQTVQWRSGDGPLLVILESKETEPEQ
jgi:hypothetical protein